MSARVAVIAETFAEPSPRSWAIPPGPTRRFRRTANVGATVFHRDLIPMWTSLGGCYKTQINHKWVPWSAEVRQQP